jgi:hypothetical protein
MTLQRAPLRLALAFAVVLDCGKKGKAYATWTFTRRNDLWLTYTRQSSGYGGEPAHQHVGLSDTTPCGSNTLTWTAALSPAN